MSYLRLLPVAVFVASSAISVLARPAGVAGATTLSAPAKRDAITHKVRHWFKDSEGNPIGYVEDTCVGTRNVWGSTDGEHSTVSSIPCYPGAICEGILMEWTLIDGNGPFCARVGYVEDLEAEYACIIGGHHHPATPAAAVPSRPEPALIERRE